MRLYPIKDKVIIEPNRDVGERKTDGGILLPDARREGAMISGTILALGSGVKDKGNIKEGATAYFDKRFQGQTLRLAEGKKILIMREEDILATEQGENK